jgi:LPS-assembly protein
LIRQSSGQNLWRNYADLSVDIRPPALARIFRHSDGTPWFKHIIEPYATYRRIVGIDEFERTLRIDERDLIAETNEFEYGVINRFFVRRTPEDGGTPQAHEVLELTLAQKYFFDPEFGGAFEEGVRNQFFPINTLSGFAFGGVRRNASPINVRARYRPNPLLFADVRMNYDPKFHQLRDLIFGGGISKGIFSVSQSWYYTRTVAVDQFRNDPSTLPGNQLDLSAFAGNPTRGPYGGFTLIYDLRGGRGTVAASRFRTSHSMWVCETRIGLSLLSHSRGSGHSEQRTSVNGGDNPDKKMTDKKSGRRAFQRPDFFVSHFFVGL